MKVSQVGKKQLRGTYRGQRETAPPNTHTHGHEFMMVIKTYLSLLGKKIGLKSDKITYTLIS
jgi:hypothetical protein